MLLWCWDLGERSVPNGNDPFTQVHLRELPTCFKLTRSRWCLVGSHAKRPWQNLDHFLHFLSQDLQLPSFYLVENYQEFELLFCEPQINDTSNSLSLVINPSLFSTIPTLKSHFEHDRFTLTQTTENLTIGWMLHLLSFGWKLCQNNISTCPCMQAQVWVESSQTEL